MIRVYTDGACTPNPGKGGWAFVIVIGDEAYADYGHEEHTTNNIMEMKAIMYAMDMINEDEPVVIYSDSKYCVDGVNSWIHKWRKKGWKKSGGAIKNLDIWKSIFSLQKEKPYISVKWVRGHNGNKGNEIADEYASYAATEQVSGNALIRDHKL